MAKSKRFSKLEYVGPVFPQEYKPVGYKLAGETLSPLAEEMCWSLTARGYKNELYWDAILAKGNFIKCLLPELTAKQKKLSWPKDFEPLLDTMKNDHQVQSDAKKLWRKEHKAEAKAETEENKKKNAPHSVAVVDGVEVKIAGCAVEAPGVIITRGDDPRIGSWKYRVNPEDVTLNIVGGSKPVDWKGNVESSPTSIWVFKYKMNCGRPEMKSFMQLNKKANFAQTTDIAKKNNEKKFGKAEAVIKNYKNIEKHIMNGLKSEDAKTRECALISWIVAETGIRIGNERNLDIFSDTVGASTLKIKNIKLLGN